MPFDAGSVIGKLGLDISGYINAIKEAGTISKETQEILDASLKHILTLDASLFEGGLKQSEQNAGEGGEKIREGLGHPELDLETEGFEGGMLRVEGLMELFPTWLTTMMVDPLLGVADLIKETTESLWDMFKEVGDDAAQMALMAEKAGVTTQYFSELSGVAKTVGISAEQLGNGFKFLQRNLAEVVEGNADAMSKQSEKLDELIPKQSELNAQMVAAQQKLQSLQAQGSTGQNLKHYDEEIQKLEKVIETRQRELDEIAKKIKAESSSDAVSGANKQAEAFERIGISVEFLKTHLNDTRGLFEAIQNGLDVLGDKATRLNVLRDVLGKGGTDLIPFFNLSKEQFQDRIDYLHKVGDVEDEESARGGLAWMKLQADAEAAWDGIKKAASEPIFRYLADHADEITAEIVGDVKWMEGEIGKFWDFTKTQDGKKIIGDLEEVGKSLLKVSENAIKAFNATDAKNFGNELLEIVKDLAGILDALAKASLWMEEHTSKKAMGGGADVVGDLDFSGYDSQQEADEAKKPYKESLGGEILDWIFPAADVYHHARQATADIDRAGSADPNGGIFGGLGASAQPVGPQVGPQSNPDMGTATASASLDGFFDALQIRLTREDIGLSSHSDGGHFFGGSDAQASGATASAGASPSPINVHIKMGVDINATRDQIAAAIVPEVHKKLQGLRREIDSANMGDSIAQAIGGQA